MSIINSAYFAYTNILFCYEYITRIFCGCYDKKRNLLYIGNRLVSILTIVDQKKVPSL